MSFDESDWTKVLNASWVRPSFKWRHVPNVAQVGSQTKATREGTPMKVKGTLLLMHVTPVAPM